MRKITKIAFAVTLAAGFTLTGAGCALSGGETYYEDCEVTDQYLEGDTTLRVQLFESDCGYWERDGDYFLREALVSGATWHWWTWVTPGQNSYAPSGWKPPHGLKPPTESHDSKLRREKREKATVGVTTKTTNSGTTPKTGTAPKGGSGNQGIPRQDTPAKPAGGAKPIKKN